MSDLTIKTKIIICAIIGFSLMIATALVIYFGAADTLSAMSNSITLRDDLIKQLQSSSSSLPANIIKADAAVADSRTSAFWKLVGVSAFGMIIFFLLALWIITSVLKPVFAAMKIIHHVSNGNLDNDIVVTNTDETGQLMMALKKMNGSLSDAVIKVHQSADLIQTASHQLGSGRTILSTETEKQAASLEQASAAMEQLTSSVAVYADTTRQASSLAVANTTLATDGGGMVTDVANKMTALLASSSKISDIVGIIDSLAFQTNILALNAAVEAARAGEQGRGFAVVASEVRSLAQRSATAAHDIRGVIAESLDMIRAGTTIATSAGNKMNEIIDSTTQVSTLMNNLADTSKEQSTALNQVSQVVVHLNDATNRYSQMVAQLSETAEILEQQSDSLVEAVSIFKV